MRQILITILCKIFLCGIITAEAEQKQGGLKFRGSMYTDLGLLHTVHSSSKDEANFAGMSVLSLNMKNKNRKYGKVEGLFDIIVPYGSTIERYIPELSDSTEEEESLLDLYKLFSFGKAPVLLDLRKLYLSIYLPFADITMGRQIINFGKGFVFSPIDVFSTVELQDINFRRSGSDIVNIRLPFSDLSGLDFITELPFLQNDYSVAAKLFTTLFDFDFSLVGIFKNAASENNNENETVAGLTFKGDAGIGLYGEAVTHYLSESHDTFFEGMLGIDYSIKDKWYFAAEYLYKQYNWDNSFWGEHNLFGSIRYTINDITNISGSIIYDFQHESTLGIFQWYYNILQNVNTIFYIQGTDGPVGQFLMYALRAEVKF
jgi:hypothetical protein